MKIFKLNKLAILLSFFFLFIFLNSISAQNEALQTKEAVILFERPSKNVAQEAGRVYPTVKTELFKTFKWETDFRPTIILVKDKEALRRTVGTNIIVAFAVPDKNLIVLDTSRVYTKPFTLEATLKHELCHLLLHDKIKRNNLPRWLDEGICQWASGGIAELMVSDGNRALAKATVSNNLISIRNLERFPWDEKFLQLAYEESKSIVEYIVSEFGEYGILQVLGFLKEGYSVDDAIQKSLTMSTSELEDRWLAHLKRKHTWFSYLSHNIYTILFSLTAIVTVYGFIRLLKKKRAYVDEAEEEDRGKGNTHFPQT